MAQHETDKTPSNWLIWAALGSIYFIWGSTYLGIRIAIETMPPLLMAGMRFAGLGVVILAWFRARGVPWPTAQQWRAALLVGGLLLLGGNGGVTWAEQYVPSSLAALLIAAVPLWTALLDWLVFRGPRPGPWVAGGLATGFLGVVLLVGPDNLAGGEMKGVAALIVAAVAWSLGSLLSRRAVLPREPMLAVGMEMLVGGCLLLLAGLVSGEWRRLDVTAVSARSWGAFAYLVVIGALVAFSAYHWLLRHTTPARATSYAYVNPVVAVVLGWALAGETVTPRMLLAAGVIVASVGMITYRRSARRAGFPARREAHLAMDP
jgi:drug/metabolite transporter (DMT)-like permease